MQGSMNKESLSSLNKISLEMDRLSSIINKEERLHNQLQSLLKREEERSNQSSLPDNFDEYFKEYDNPTTKSLPIDDDSRVRLEEEDTEIMNTIYRNRLPEDSAEDDPLHDDNSTVILNATNHRKPRQDQPTPANCYSSLNQDNRRKEPPRKKTAPKNPTSSMPSEVLPNSHKPASLKNNSLSKPNKTDSPLAHARRQPPQPTEEPNFIRQLKGKLSKVSKIDREELTRLQERKLHKKTELSSNRKKTKRELGSAKSTTNMHTQKTSLTNIALAKHPASHLTAHPSHTHINAHKTAAVTAKAFTASKPKKDSLAKKDERAPSNHDWQRNLDKTGKKLNRVNICKLQENIKKNHEKKAKEGKEVRERAERAERGEKEERRELKLHFTESDESVMRRLIEEKELGREYARETEKYLEAIKRMSKSYFQVLIRECREPSEEAIFKLRLVTLLLYFFDQFASSALLAHPCADADSLFTRVGEEEVMDTLLHPKRLLRLMEQLPDTLMGENTLCAERVRSLGRYFTALDEELDQELELFLIKKSALYMMVHSLLEYVRFLTQRQLVAQTKRSRLPNAEAVQKLQGYYSSRSKREEISRKYIRKTEKANKLGFRCDSDRKITLEDEEAFLRAFNCPNPKPNPLKKGPK